MSKAQRIVVVFYCLLFVYCSLWIPWRVPVGVLHQRYERLGYGWLWAGPPPPAPLIVEKPPVSVAQKPDTPDKVASENAVNNQQSSGGYTIFGEYDPSTGRCIGDCGAPPHPSAQVGAPSPPLPPPLPDPSAEPDLRLMSLRFFAATAAATAAFLVAGMWKSSATLN